MFTESVDITRLLVYNIYISKKQADKDKTEMTTRNEYPTNNNTIHNKQGRLSVYQDVRTKLCHAVFDDGILIEPSDPYKMRTPVVIAKGTGSNLIEALCNLQPVSN